MGGRERDDEGTSGGEVSRFHRQLPLRNGDARGSEALKMQLGLGKGVVTCLVFPSLSPWEVVCFVLTGNLA